jgi:hypothetical protein
MKAFVALSLSFFVSAAIRGSPSCPRVLDAKTEAYLTPVLKSLAEARGRGASFDGKFETQFYRLLEATGPSARRARVALMDYYVGESYSEELVCAVATDGSSELLDLFTRCDIPPRQSPLERNHISSLRQFAREMIQRGQVKEECTIQ